MRSESGAVHRAREMEGREDAQPAREGRERLLGPRTKYVRWSADRGTGLTCRLTGERSESG